MLFQHSYEMVCVLLSVVFRSKIVHTEVEVNRMTFVGLKTGHEFALLVPFSIQKFL